MDKVAKGMTQSGEKVATLHRPQKGDKFRCETCGMQIQVTANCKCDQNHAHFHCCDREMSKL